MPCALLHKGGKLCPRKGFWRMIFALLIAARVTPLAIAYTTLQLTVAPRPSQGGGELRVHATVNGRALWATRGRPLAGVVRAAVATIARWDAIRRQYSDEL